MKKKTTFGKLKKRVFAHTNNFKFKDTNKYNPMTGVSGYRLFWNSQTQGTYVRGSAK